MRMWPSELDTPAQSICSHLMAWHPVNEISRGSPRQTHNLLKLVNILRCLVKGIVKHTVQKITFNSKSFRKGQKATPKQKIYSHPPHPPQVRAQGCTWKHASVNGMRVSSHGASDGPSGEEKLFFGFSMIFNIKYLRSLERDCPLIRDASQRTVS